MNALTAKELNMLRGAYLKSHENLDRNDITRLFKHIDALEGLLNDGDQNDAFGTQGWRYFLGIDE
jgi:hypothetical protein